MKNEQTDHGTTLSISVGSRIAALRQDKKMTQEEFAMRLGVTPQAVSKWERSLSMPDLAIFSDCCKLLNTSADFLLGLAETENILEPDLPLTDREEILYNLRSNYDYLRIFFGTGVTELFLESDDYFQRITDIRKKLAGEGMLMPTVRIMDDARLSEHDFVILSFEKVLYHDTVTKEEGIEKILNALEAATRSNYGEILTNDLLKQILSNLKKSLPTLIEGVVPEKISYTLLRNVMKGFMVGGNSFWYLPKVIEIVDSALTDDSTLRTKELVEIVKKELCTEDNYTLWLHKHTPARSDPSYPPASQRTSKTDQPEEESTRE